MNLSNLAQIFTYKKGKVTRFLASAALLTLALYFVADGLAGIARYALQGRAVLVEDGQTRLAATAPPARPDYGVVSDRNLFGAKGEASAAPQTPPQQNSPGPASSKFSLVGTALSEAGMGNLAIIKRNDDKKQLFLYEGDALDEYRLKRIMRHKVVLETAGNSETLTMKFESGAVKKPPRTQPRPAPPRQMNPPPQAAEQNASAKAQPDQPRTQAVQEAKVPAAPPVKPPAPRNQARPSLKK